MEHTKYQRDLIFNFPNRTWPDKEINKAPIWCSVDLRDGNQSLEIPMTTEQKLNFFKFIVGVGFKEIEVGFPAASESEFQFIRMLIEDKLIPDDVVIQVLTQSRDVIIRRTFESLKGVHKAVVHLYNSTSPLQRDVVFQKSKDEIKALAVSGAELLNELADEYGPERFIFEYSPESFSQTEPEYALEVCNAVLDCWRGRPVIINLPFTVETAMPNVYADVIEYMCGSLRDRENIIVSLHAHNDRGTAVAATELCLLAGADRVEGTLFGNGERTGNADLITLAMNLYAHGIDPGLDFSNIDTAVQVYKEYTNLPVHPRHPYAGELVYTAFSGSHQDAIRKGMARMKSEGGTEPLAPDRPAGGTGPLAPDRPAGGIWRVPYLPIDPMDVGRSYDPIIRFNSQSGSSSAAYILETYYDIIIPKAMQRDFGPTVINESDSKSVELSPADIFELFKHTYVNIEDPVELLEWDGFQGTIKWKGQVKTIKGSGDGVVEAFCQGLMEAVNIQFDIKHYSQHALESGREARAITYVGLSTNDKKIVFGAGISRNITTSSLKAVVSALNRVTI